MAKMKGAKTVVVCGDITVDWNIARIRRGDHVAHEWNADDLTCAFCQRGGAAMLSDLLEAVASSMKPNTGIDVNVRKPVFPRDRIRPDDRRFPHSYAIWAPFETAKPGLNHKGKVWRVEEFLGLHRADTGLAKKDSLGKLADDALEPDLIVIDDADLGFRGNPALWPKSLLEENSKTWFLIKMARPVARGALWEELVQNHADRLVVVMTANDLRRSQVHISHRISWERTAQDIVWELNYNPHVNALTRCAYTVVSFDTAGAILLSRKHDRGLEATLFFDPVAMEGEWGRESRGFMIGYTTCLATGIARELIVNAADPYMLRGIQSGIRAMRLLHEHGYGTVSSEHDRIQLAFPVQQIAEWLEYGEGPLSVAPVKSPAHALSAKTRRIEYSAPPDFWTILEDQKPHTLDEIARRIVVEGLEEAMSGVPTGQFGKMKTVDRREIEGLRSVSGLIDEYCQQRRINPLSIAVFGPPGAGKSFAVKEVANSVRPGEIEALSFNLSQFGGPDDLLDAFHQVRDKALSGSIPLVFWDEFDTALHGQKLGWLRYFLVPMQDGEFQQGQILHPIGQSIFIFAGGTSHGMDSFTSGLKDESSRTTKLPDFISRLKGFLNILGPNRQTGGDSGSGDPYYIIRRAIILRTIFERNAPQLLRTDDRRKVLNIDRELLHAFLTVREYRHGVRSMESIVTMSQLTGKTNFDRSSLPAETQLNLHVDGREFIALMHRLEPDEELLEKLAEAAHHVFCENLRAGGYTYGIKNDKVKKTHSSLMPYSGLPEDEKAQNRDNARDIPNKLAAVGYAMVPAHTRDEAQRLFNADEVEKLARLEHERWMREKLDAGWKSAKRTNKSKKLHKDLVPWDQLPDDEREKDCTLVRGIPIILAEAGYVMIKLD